MHIPDLNPKTCETVVFSEHPEHDTIWTITLGHDDQVYIGLCLEGSGGGVAQLYTYDTQVRQLRHLADMEDVTGESPLDGHATQGKIHFSLCHATDGKVYGATHCTTPPVGQTIWSPFAMWGDPVMSFTGSHIFRYDTLTGEAVDFGVITPNEGIPYLLLNEQRGRLYGVTYPKAHFFSCNLVGRDFVDYGRVSSMYPISMIMDKRGNVYTSDFASRLIKYDVERDSLIHLATRPYTEPWNPLAIFSPVSDMCMGSDGLIYGVVYCNDHLFRFDPNQDEPQIEDLGPGLEEVPAEGLRCMVPDRQGNIYYTVNQKMNSPMGNILARYNVANGTKEPVAMTTLAGEKYFSWRGVCDAAGNVYLACIHRTPINLLVYRPDKKR